MALEIGLKVVIIPHRLLQDVAEVCLLQANWGEFTRPPIIAIVINPRSIIFYTILNIIFPNKVALSEKISGTPKFFLANQANHHFPLSSTNEMVLLYISPYIPIRHNPETWRKYELYMINIPQSWLIYNAPVGYVNIKF